MCYIAYSRNEGGGRLAASGAKTRLLAAPKSVNWEYSTRYPDKYKAVLKEDLALDILSKK